MMTEDLSDRENRQLEPSFKLETGENILNFWTETQKRFMFFIV